MATGPAFRAWVVAAALALPGCSGTAEDVAATRSIEPGSAVDATTYAGDVAFRMIDTFPAGDRDVPLELFLGLSPGSGTRLAANALIDLRALQQELPGLLSGVLEPSCALDLDVSFEGAEAVGQSIEARANVDATFYRCRNRGTEEEARGRRLFGEAIDVRARIGGDLAGDCIEFRLEDLDLAPQSLLGRIASLFGVTDRVRSAVVAQARATLSENQVCPDLPEAILPLAPEFSSFSLHEIGSGGMGATASGSVDLAADKLLRVLAAAESSMEGTERNIRVAEVLPDTLKVEIEDALTIRESEVPYLLEIGLSIVGPTRIGVETMIDLRQLQARLPDLLAGETLVETCGGSVLIDRLEIEGSAAVLIATGKLDVTTYECDRTAPGTWKRGAVLKDDEVGVRADMSADLVENCIVFRLLDIVRDPPGAIAQLDTGSGRTQAARALLIEAVGLILEDNPLCPELPAELIALDPSFDRGAPQEIGKGGVGVAFNGSIDLSPRNVVDLLRQLQARGAVPPAP